MRYILLAAMLVAFGAAFDTTRAVGQRPVVGGFKSVAVDDPEVTAAASFAVEAQGQKEDTTIDLLSVVSAERQTVAGANYRLCLEVEGEGGSQVVRALVFKSLRKEYQLKSWQEADCGEGD